jgi:hypothetical protein
MTNNDTKIAVYLEIGQKKVIAGAVDWPGWQRIGRSEADSLEALIDYVPRYGRILDGTNLTFPTPTDVNDFTIVERLEGTTTTDFGAPALPPDVDLEAVDDTQLDRLVTILQASWQAFDKACQAAEGKHLRKGPRGGGRELEGIMEHVLGADQGYLSSLGWKYKKDKNADLPTAIETCRTAILEGLAAAVRGEIPAEGPRGGKRWPPRYYVRRSVWHTTDHIWEIEDRIE